MSLAPGRHSGLLVPLFSMPSRASWGIGEIGDIPIAASWLRAAGQDLLQLLPINEMAVGQRSPYSALTAMAIDPIFISVHAVDEFRSIGGEAAMDAAWRERLDAARRSPAIDHALVREREAAGAARRLRRVRQPSRAAGVATGGVLPRVVHGPVVVARRLRALPRAPRPAGRPLVDGVARAAARPRAARPRARARRAVARDPLPHVAAVDRRHAVARGEGGVASRLAAGRPRLHGGRGQRRRLGERRVVPARRVRRRPARRVQRDRPEVGDAGLPLGRARRERLRVAARPRAPHGVALRRLPRRSPRGLLPDLLVPERRHRGVVLAARRAVAARARRNGHGDLRGARLAHHRRRPRHRSRLRPRVDRPPRRSRLQGLPLGARVGGRGASRTAIRPSTRPIRWPPPARTTPSRSPPGGTASTPRSAPRCSRRPASPNA